jgi:hypothetical protein
MLPIEIRYAEVAQSVEQRTENPCVGSSILPLGILFKIKSTVYQLVPHE